MHEEPQHPFVVDFPLRGEWFCPNTPGDKIPSHGTDAFAQRYAYDFMMADWSHRKMTPLRGSKAAYLLFGTPLDKWYGWGQPIYAPCDGKVIVARDGYPERQRVFLIRDMLIALKNACFYKPAQGPEVIAGNHVILQTENAFALFAHIAPGSICVQPGQAIKAGQMLGRVGHTGNSTAPHLHFQLMDGPDPFTAKGLPCAFSRYEIYEESQWTEVQNGIPKSADRIRAKG